MTLALAQNPLQHKVDHYVSRGYHLLSQTDTSAQLIRKKQYQLSKAAFWLIAGLGIGLLVYTAAYVAAPVEESVYLLMDAAGQVKVGRR